MKGWVRARAGLRVVPACFLGARGCRGSQEHVPPARAWAMGRCIARPHLPDTPPTHIRALAHPLAKVVPILRAGLVLLEQAGTVLPVSETYHVGYVRDETTLQVRRACGLCTLVALHGAARRAPAFCPPC